MLVVAAMSFLVVIGFMAAALDGSNAYAQRRLVQNASDAGALVGAQAVNLGSDDSVICALIDEYTRERNKASSFAATYIPGGEPVCGASVPGDATGVAVTTTTTFPTYFAGVIYDSAYFMDGEGGSGIILVE